MTNLTIAPVFRDFVETELLPDLGIKPDTFWGGLEKIVGGQHTNENRELLSDRDWLQAKIDAWHEDHPADQWDVNEYKGFLTEIG